MSLRRRRRDQSLKDWLLSNIEVNPKTGCWIWKRGTNVNGYGVTTANGKRCLTHRAAYGVFVGPIPEGVHVLHRCDVASCINPEHLFLGTHTVNMQDMSRKGRHVGARKLEPSQILEIRQDLRPYALIAADYGVSKSNVSRIQTGDTWRYL